MNNDVITLSEVEKRAAPELARVDQEATGPERAQKRAAALKRILDTMIDEKLVDNELRELKVSISDKEVDSAVDEVKKSYNLTDEQLQQAVAREGYSIAEYREQMRKQIGRYKLISEKVRKNVKVSDADVQSEYDRMTRSEGEDYEVHVRHILIAVPRNASSAQVEQARRKAAAVAVEARESGVNFAELAKTRSEGSSSSDGGDLGFFKRGTMVPEFERVAFNLKTGEVSEPVRTQFGWHVLKLEEIRKLGMKPLAEVRPEIEDRLRRAQADRLTSQYMETLRSAAVVEKKILSGAPAAGRPRVGISLGDPSGIGPEIVDRALAHPGVRRSLVPVVFGDGPTFERLPGLRRLPPVEARAALPPDGPARVAVTELAAKNRAPGSRRVPAGRRSSPTSPRPSRRRARCSSTRCAPRRCRRSRSPAPACRSWATPRCSPRPSGAR